MNLGCSTTSTPTPTSQIYFDTNFRFYILKTMEFRFTIALIYDFDGTLAPGNMQEYDFIPAVGKSNKEFWTEANTLAEEQDADMVLTYMARMIQEAKSKGLSLRREAFQD